MARQANNQVMKGTRGMFGKQVVFKIRKGKQIVAAPPDIDQNRLPTPNQLAAQDRFKFSSEYANKAIKDAHLKAAYQNVASKRQSAQNMAFKDAYNPPEVLNMITQGYTGAVGNIILVHAVDDFKVTSVTVSILNDSSEVIEKGEAVTDTYGVVWVYTITVANKNVKGCKAVATAFDLPGNEDSMQCRIVIFCGSCFTQRRRGSQRSSIKNLKSHNCDLRFNYKVNPGMKQLTLNDWLHHRYTFYLLDILNNRSPERHALSNTLQV